MHYKKPDRVPLTQIFGSYWFWPETIHRWYGEGLPPGMSVQDYFGFDRFEFISLDSGPIPAFVPKIIHEDERYIIQRDFDGVTKKSLKGKTSMPVFIDFPVKTREDWEKRKERLDPHDPRRYPKTWGEELIEYYNELEWPVGIFLGSSFGWLRRIMGLKRLLINLFKDPDWIHEMLEFRADFQVELLKPFLEEVKVDYGLIWEDMAYNKGPHVSPKTFEEFFLPYYEKVIGYARSKGVDIIALDTDGNFEVLVPLYLKGGVNCIFPLEVAAGINAVELRKKFGREIRLVGNIDKRVLVKGKEAIRREIESKVPVLIEDGGYIPAIDHFVPSDVPFKNFKYYIELLKEYIGYE